MKTINIYGNVNDLDGFTYRLLYGRGVPLGNIGSGVAISARGLKPQGLYGYPVPI